MGSFARFLGASLIIVALCVLFRLYRSDNYTDMTNSIVLHSLELPTGFYRSIVWVSERRLVFLYSQLPPAGLWDYQMIAYDPTSERWEEISFEINEACRSSWIVGLESLPNGLVTFLYRCNLDFAKGYDKMFSLNLDTGEIDLLYEYPEGLFPRQYSFAPDMRRFVQAEFGGMAHNYIYLIDRKLGVTRLFEDYQQVGFPSWAPNGSEIAYFGTKAIRAESEGLFALLDRGRDLLLGTWDLYISQPDGRNERRLLNGVQLPGPLKWSPQGINLAFAGVYEGVHGIWIFNVQTSMVSRVWPTEDSFDWSPDGTALVVLGQTTDDGSGPSNPIIVQFPQLAEVSLKHAWNARHRTEFLPQTGCLNAV